MRRFPAALCLVLLAFSGVGPAQAAPLGGPVVFEPKPGTLLQVAGKGAYRGSIEVRRGASGVTVVNVLDLDSYLMGLAEVPGSWPAEAMKAQAVAARTYALWEAGRGSYRDRGYDICGTTSCQVYSGVAHERGPNGDKWVEAVRATRGEVLLHDNKPILARYHSSSGGHTLSNEVVYPSSGKHPYLKGVPDEPDDRSPLYRWTVDFTKQEMEAILRRGVDLAGTLEAIEADEQKRELVVRTQGGRLEMNIVRFRREVSSAAPKLFPEKYPSLRADGRRLPLTLPSSRFTIEATPEGFRINGRGYGHGVGMSQWGARGRAERGDDYKKILAAYYGGLKPRTLPREEPLRVGIVPSTQRTSVSGDGLFSVADGRSPLSGSTLGSWQVAPGAGRTLDVTPPESSQLPLVLSGVRAPGRVVTRDEPLRLEVSFVVPKAAQVQADLVRGDDKAGTVRGVFDAGPGRLAMRIDPRRHPEPGDWRLVLSATDGTASVRSVRPVRVERPARRGLVLVMIAAVMLAVAVVLRRRHALYGRGSQGREGANWSLL
ncbi:MAG TPA: SpoIID/LytB domain-containing protein [Actinomycetota bacterium]|nr:SpoIID/LytB domain-containing protein [Actinomycetota bacterium]